MRDFPHDCGTVDTYGVSMNNSSQYYRVHFRIEQLVVLMQGFMLDQNERLALLRFPRLPESVAYPGGFLVARKPPPRGHDFCNNGVTQLLAPTLTSHWVWAQYSIYLPVHYRRIKSLLFWDGTPFWDFLAA